MFQKKWLSYRTVRSATEKFPAPEILLKSHFEMPLRPPSGRRNRHIRHARSPINYEGDVFLHDVCDLSICTRLMYLRVEEDALSW